MVQTMCNKCPKWSKNISICSKLPSPKMVKILPTMYGHCPKTVILQQIYKAVAHWLFSWPALWFVTKYVHAFSLSYHPLSPFLPWATCWGDEATHSCWMVAPRHKVCCSLWHHVLHYVPRSFCPEFSQSTVDALLTCLVESPNQMQRENCKSFMPRYQNAQSPQTHYHRCVQCCVCRGVDFLLECFVILELNDMGDHIDQWMGDAK